MGEFFIHTYVYTHMHTTRARRKLGVLTADGMTRLSWNEILSRPVMRFAFDYFQEYRLVMPPYVVYYEYVYACAVNNKIHKYDNEIKIS